MQRWQGNELHRANPMRSDIATIEMIARGARSAGAPYAIRAPASSQTDLRLLRELIDSNVRIHPLRTLADIAAIATTCTGIVSGGCFRLLSL